MILSQNEIMLILKKQLPASEVKDLDKAAKAIINQSKQWQEVDLNEHIHDEVETGILHDICKRTSTGRKQPEAIRLFFK